jgi:hypothetical protein
MADSTAIPGSYAAAKLGESMGRLLPKWAHASRIWEQGQSQIHGRMIK